MKAVRRPLMPWQDSTVAVLGTVAVLMSSAEPLAAQLKPYAPTGTRVAKAPEKVAQKTVRVMEKDFARCVYGRAKSRSEQLLAHSDAGSIDYAGAGTSAKTLGDDFSLDECLSEAMTFDQGEVEMRFSPPLLVNLLAEEAYLATGPKPLTIPQNGVETVARNFVSTADDLDHARVVAAFSDCVVFTDIADSDALVRTLPATADEQAVIRKLTPALGQCVMEGQSISLTPANIRTFVADGLWARAHYGTTVVAPAPAEGVRK